MSKQPTPANTGYSTPTAPQLPIITGGPPSSGVTITPEVWAQMQAMFAMFAAPPLAGPITVPPGLASLASVGPIIAPPGLAPSSTHLTTIDQCVPAGSTASLAQSADSPAKSAHSLGQLAGFAHLIPPLDESTPCSPAPSIAGVQAPSSLGSSVSSCGGDLEPNKLPNHDLDHNDEDIHAGEIYRDCRPKPLDPPPSAKFNSRGDLLKFTQEWAKHHAYAISTANSHAGKNVYLQCDRSGDFRGSVVNNSGRQAATTKIRCPFRLKGSIPTSQKIDIKFWTLSILNANHNHEPSPSPSAHAAHRQLLPEQLRASDNETYATNKTISNLLQKNRRLELDGKTPVEALMCILKQSNWTWDIKVDSSGSVQRLFFAHPGSIHLARVNHHVALLDATYKTNRYKLPLLHIIGQAASNRLFSIGFCFLTYEDNENYLWAVNNLKKYIWRPQRVPKVFVTDRDTALRNALEEVFPDSQANLCTWHINKNIASNCKSYFPSIKKSEKKKPKKNDKKTLTENKPDNPWDIFMGLWNQVTYSKSPEIYDERLAILKEHLKTRPAVLDYLESSILPVKDLFVVAWACQYPHLRNLNTSRAESGHAYFKTFVTNSTGDLLTVFKLLALAVDAQINWVHESIARDTVKTLVNVPKCFIPLLGYISTFAIKECIDQFKRLADLDPTEPCSRTLTIGVGIPCAHKIAELLESGDSLNPEDFHSQWHLKYNPEFTHTDEPEIDLDAEIRNLSVALANEPSNNLVNILSQLK
ncbi:hypothetical protein PSTT_07447 [Puccinia striiformis]|uniref:MULE transposase domain-containing protein n=1 Tax=Puccinia striiformis TaxID=27350 RepID=A0A2S4VG63_9BASI|nr:hypothetical protein PSTT_07447 [Puccinia striiformis]